MKRVVMMLALAFAPAAHAEQVLDHIKASGVLRVGTTGDYKPFTFRSSDGAYSGADIDMARQLASQLGVKVEFVPTAWGKLNSDYQAGKFDIAMGGISVLPARVAMGPFSHAVDVDGKRPIARCADSARYNSIAAIDQPDVRVVVNPGASNEAFARANFPHAKLTVFNDNVSIFGEIIAGREDVMVTDGIEVQHQAAVHPELCGTAVPEAFTRQEKGYWVARDSDLLSIVNGFVDTEISSGRWKATLDRELLAP